MAEPWEQQAHELLNEVVALRAAVAQRGKATFRRWRPHIKRAEFAVSAYNFAHYLAFRRAGPARASAPAHGARPFVLGTRGKPRAGLARCCERRACPDGRHRRRKPCGCRQSASSFAAKSGSPPTPKRCSEKRRTAAQANPGDARHRCRRGPGRGRTYCRTGRRCRAHQLRVMTMPALGENDRPCSRRGKEGKPTHPHPDGHRRAKGAHDRCLDAARSQSSRGRR